MSLNQDLSKHRRKSAPSAIQTTQLQVSQYCIDTMKLMADGFVDLVVTSPPYDEMREYEGYSLEGFEHVAEVENRRHASLKG